MEIDIDFTQFTVERSNETDSGLIIKYDIGMSDDEISFLQENQKHVGKLLYVNENETAFELDK